MECPRCPVCDSEAGLKTTKAKIDGEECEVECYACTKCGEEFFCWEQKGRIDSLVKKKRKTETAGN